MSEGVEQPAAVNRPDSSKAKKPGARRRLLWRILGVVTGIAFFTLTVVWAWFAFGPTGLARERARVVAELAAASLPLPLEPPPPPSTQAAGFPESAEAVLLMADIDAFHAKAVPLVGGFAYLATPRLASWSKAFSPDTKGMVIERLRQDVPEPPFPYTPGTPRGVSVANLRIMEDLVAEARVLQRRTLALLPQLHLASDLRYSLVGQSDYGVIASMPLGGDRRPEEIVEHVRLLLSDHESMRLASEGYFSAQATQLLIDLWCMNANTAATAPGEIMALLDATDALYSDTEWQRLNWEASLLERHRQVSFLFHHTTYTQGGGSRPSPSNRKAVERLPALFRPLISNQFDTYTAARLRDDGNAAHRARHRLDWFASLSGIEVPSPGDYEFDAYNDKFWTGRRPFRAIDPRHFTGLLRIVTAVGAFRANMGREPESLAELMPDYLLNDDPRLSPFELIRFDVGPGNAPLDGDNRQQIGVLEWRVEYDSTLPVSSGPAYESAIIHLPMRMDGYRDALNALSSAGALTR